MSDNKEDFKQGIFKEKAIDINQDNDEFENCRSYSQILDVIDQKEHER